MNVNELYHWQTASQPMRCTLKCGHMVMIGKDSAAKGVHCKALGLFGFCIGTVELKQC